MEEKKLYINGEVVAYKLYRKKIKNLILKVDQNGTLMVSAHPLITQKTIDAFLIERSDWIMKNKKRQQQKYDRLFSSVENQAYFYLFDECLKLICIQANKKDVLIEDGNMYVYYKQAKSECDAIIKNFIKRFCMQELTDIVSEYVLKVQNDKIKMPTITYRHMKTRWGSCSTTKNKITLNVNLIHYPIRFVEYVILHELVHFIVPNHSKAFYEQIAIYMPDYEERKKLVSIDN